MIICSSWCLIKLMLHLFLDQIDKDGASPERVMQELSSVGLMPEDWGGDIPMVQVHLFSGWDLSFHLFMLVHGLSWYYVPFYRLVPSKERT